MSNITQNLEKFKGELTSVCRDCGRNPSEISLVAVTKNRSVDEVNELLAAGVSRIGENRLQEFLAKKDEIKSCEKHFVGWIQSNKAREIAREFDVVESVASVKIARILNSAVNPRDLSSTPIEDIPGVNSKAKKLPIFLQANLAREPQKSGFLEEEIEAASVKIRKLPNLKIEGLMVMGVFNDLKKTREVFLRGKSLCRRLGFKDLSAGMSGDWQIAVEEGANFLRIGRGLFE